MTDEELETLDYPRIGQKVVIASHFPDSELWNRDDWFVDTVSRFARRGGKGYDVTICDKSGSEPTDGFVVGDPTRKDDLIWDTSQQARIEELEAAQDWQPIETAPKDGTMVFVWFPDMPKGLPGEYEDRIKLGRFVEELQEWSVQGVGGNMPPKVTHWRPLFDAPKGTDDDG